MRSRVVIVLAMLMAMASLPVAAGAAGSDGDSSRVGGTETIRWRSCYRWIGPNFECARVRVPLDYDKPNGAKIQIALARIPATDPDARIGSLFINPGGPGGSGVDLVLGAGEFLYTDEVRAKFDMVGFDPRGIARSTPLRCFGSLDEAFGVLPPFAFPVTPEEEAIQFQSDLALAAACEDRATAIQDHMSTANVVRDLDLLRQLVGDEGLTYAGYSYGSFIGAVYSNLFPNNVRALVVDGVLDPIAWTTGRGDEAITQPFSYRLRSDAGAQATLEEFFRLCDEGGPGVCALAPNASQRFADVTDALLEQPIEIPLDPSTGDVLTITYADVVGLTLGSLYDSFSWPDLAAVIADIESLGAVEEVALSFRALAQEVGLEPPREPYSNFVEGFVGVACTDTVNPEEWVAWPAAAADADARFGYFGRPWTFATSPCGVWTGADGDAYLGPFDGTTSNTVLVVGNSYDPATRYEGALTLRSLLPNSSLLTMDGWGHVSIFLSACADQAVGDYLVTTIPPPDGLVCQPDFVPFLDSIPGLADDVEQEQARQRTLEEIPKTVTG